MMTNQTSKWTSTKSSRARRTATTYGFATTNFSRSAAGRCEVGSRIGEARAQLVRAARNRAIRGVIARLERFQSYFKAVQQLLLARLRKESGGKKFETMSQNQATC